MTQKLPFTQASIRSAIRSAHEEGRQVVGIRADGTVLSEPYPTNEGPLHISPRMFDRERAAAYCRCDEKAFSAFIKDKLLPDRVAGTKRWDRKVLDVALERIDIRPDGATEASNEVYFITDGSFIKIGYSGSAIVRLQALQTSTPHQLSLLFSMPGALRAETRLHELFSHLRKQGEWFSKSPGLLAYIEWLRTRKR